MKRKKKKQPLKIYKGSTESLVFKPLLFIDFEYITTSYRDNGHRQHLQEIIEAAGILVNNQGYKTFNEIVKPKLFLKSVNTAELNKITYDEISKGIELSTLIVIFRQFYIPGITKVISWGSSDLHNLNHLCTLYGIQFHIRKDDYIDLSQKFRRFYKLNQAISLDKALAYLDINDKFDKHRALPDAEMLLRIFDKSVEDGYLDEEFIQEV